MLRRTIIGCGQTWKLGDRSEKSSITGILDHIVVEQDRLHFIFGLLFSKAIRCWVNEAWHLTFDFKFLYSLGRKTDVTWVGDVKDVSKYGNISTEFFLIVCVCVCAIDQELSLWFVRGHYCHVEGQNRNEKIKCWMPHKDISCAHVRWERTAENGRVNFRIDCCSR